MGAATQSSLASLAALLREDPVISPHVRDSAEEPALGELAAAGPRAAEARDAYKVLFEAIREGYLLHYGTSRLLDGADPDLRLLTGDYLYALGLERLAARGDLPAVQELADLISLSAQLHADEREPDAGERTAPAALWLASAVAVGVGADDRHQRAKRSLRDGDSAAVDELVAVARERAEDAGIVGALARAADSVGFAILDLQDRG
jgi:hypothetical protein